MTRRFLFDLSAILFCQIGKMSEKHSTENLNIFFTVLYSFHLWCWLYLSLRLNRKEKSKSAVVRNHRFQTLNFFSRTHKRSKELLLGK